MVWKLKLVATATNGLAINFSGFKAGSTDVFALGVAIYECTNILNVWIPATASTTL